MDAAPPGPAVAFLRCMTTETVPLPEWRAPHSPVLRALSLLTLAAFGAWALVLGWAARSMDAAGPPGELSAAAAYRPLPPEALRAAETAVRRELERGAFPGAALALGQGPHPQYRAGFGAIGWREQAAPVSPDTTLYDMASVTKAMATTAAVLLLAEEGRIHLDEPLRRHLPEFEGQFKDRVTWRHVLSHTAGLPGGAVLRGETPDERLRRVLRTRIPVPPGRVMVYTDVGFLAAWAAAENAAGEPLTEYLERKLWRPLGMHATRFSPGQECTACAPTLRLDDGTPYRGRPHDLIARRLGGVAGNAGLFSTAHDVGRFVAMVANGGELDGVRVLRPESVREMLTQQPGAGRRTLGWVAVCPGEDPPAGIPCRRPEAVIHNGYTGTSVYLDPETGVWAVLLSNRTYDIRAEERMEPLRWTTFRAVAAAARQTTRR
jgi:serine-type D-Ala-D-Ala carboxypeptidase